MTTAYPAALDTLTNPGATTWTDGTTRTDGVNPDGAANPLLYGDAQEANQNDCIEAIEAKVGTGASTPASNTVFMGTGTGTSAWTATSSAPFPRKYAATFGDGTATSFAINHALGTQDVTWSIRDLSSQEFVDVKVVATDTNNVTVSAFLSTPTTNQYRIVVLG